MPVTWQCIICGKEKTTAPSRVGKFCGNKCVAIHNSQRLDTHTYSDCEVCGITFKTKPSHLNKRRTCSKKCSGYLKVAEMKDCGSWNANNSYDKNHNWKSGRRVREDGYVYVRLEDGSEMLEHRYVMEQYLGRKLLPEEHVHHRDENKENNESWNLELTDKSSHSSYHAKKRFKEGTHHFLK